MLGVCVWACIQDLHGQRERKSVCVCVFVCMRARCWMVVMLLPSSINWLLQALSTQPNEFPFPKFIARVFFFPIFKLLLFFCWGAEDQLACLLLINTVSVVSGWSKWMSWSVCSAQCGGGLTWRQRMCYNADNSSCVGEAYQEMQCNMHSCTEQKGERWWINWGSYKLKILSSCGEWFSSWPE